MTTCGSFATCCLRFDGGIVDVTLAILARQSRFEPSHSVSDRAVRVLFVGVLSLIKGAPRASCALMRVRDRTGSAPWARRAVAGPTASTRSQSVWQDSAQNEERPRRWAMRQVGD